MPDSDKSKVKPADPHAIADAVLGDPVVKAVLKDISSGAASPTPPAPRHMILPSGQAVAVPTSTEEDDRGTAGQRAINLLWETTQAKIAVSVVYCVLIVAGLLSLSAMMPWATEKQVALAITAFMLLSSLSTLVIGFYYGRSNHTKVGGVPPPSR